MATIEKWTPYGVALDVTATTGTVVRTSATSYTVVINASWKTYYSGAKTNFGMSAYSGGVTKVISAFGTSRSSGSASFTGTYQITGNGSTKKTITVTFINYEEDSKGNVTKSANKNINLTVTVPAWTSYTVTYNANGGTGAPSKQTKWKGQVLTLSSTKPTKTGHSFSKWNTEADGSGTSYNAGGAFGLDANTTLYAIWTPNTYFVKFNANDGTGAPGNQTKTYGVTLKLSTVIPTKTDYRFLGWATSATATSVEYTAGGNYTKNSSVTLYAVWENAYTKPSITNLTADRCDSNGTLSDEGTYASLGFKWSCVATISSVCIYWNIGGIEKSVCLQTTDNTGSARIKIGAGEFNTETTYQITVKVMDANGQNEASVTLNSLKFLIDALAENKGIAFGKTAENEGEADFGFKIHPRVGYIHPVIAAGSDLNNATNLGIYSGENVSTNPYANCPITAGTFTLEVMSAGPNGQLYQRLTRCDKNIPEAYERWYYASTWGDWYGGWIYPTLTSAFAMYGEDPASNQPRYRKDGRMVEVRGIVTPTSTIAAGDEFVTIFTLPNGYRPSSPIYVLCQGSGNCMWLMRVSSNGDVGFSRYRKFGSTTTYVDAPTNTWLPFQVTYFAK